jgi:release factor glutamine methyltransferase
MTIHQTLRSSKLSPLDAELILSFIIKKPREYLFACPEKKLTISQTAKFNNLEKRCLRGEPIAYIRGKKEFYGLEFRVDRNVLIPRPETELLVSKALNIVLNTKRQVLNAIFDIGTGSGNIIISMVKNIPSKDRMKISFFASDISKNALKIAKTNAQKHKVCQYIKFIKSDFLSLALQKKLKGNILIIANLPYVSKKIYRKYKNSLRYEPKTALISEMKGLGHYIRLFKQIRAISSNLNISGISCFLEYSPEQKSFIKKMVQKYLPQAEIEFHKDLAGRNRAVQLNIS